ncbi:MAG: ThiF family adenylyltransferase [Bryobacteraceae bacterium]
MTPNNCGRYSRQIRYEPFGEAGQRSLLNAKVAIVGCGALGSFQAGAMARAGTGRIVLIDRDYVELSNLQRQWLFEEQDVADALPKAVAGARHLRAINSSCEVTPVVQT